MEFRRPRGSAFASLGERRHEYANLFNPFWEAKLAPTTWSFLIMRSTIRGNAMVETVVALSVLYALPRLHRAARQAAGSETQELRRAPLLGVGAHGVERQYEVRCGCHGSKRSIVRSAIPAPA